MIFRGVIEIFDRESIIFFPAIILMVSAIFCVQLIQNYSSLYLLMITLILTEVYYHIEPRTKDDKKEGRSWFRVFYKKVDSLFDAILTTGVIALIYEGLRRITINGLLRVADILGIIVLSIVAIIIYIWLNGLRDRSKKRSKKK